MKEMIIIYWFIFKPFRYLTYKKRLQQGMSKNYSYEFVSERTHQEIMAYLRTIKIEEKRFLQLQEENADIVNDKVLQDICDMGMGSPIDRLKDDEPFDEEKYLDNARSSLIPKIFSTSSFLPFETASTPFLIKYFFEYLGFLLEVTGIIPRSLTNFM